jgi:predicted transposase YbfD/YdcC
VTSGSWRVWAVNPFTGRYRVPDERTLREAYGRVDPAALAAAGYGYLNSLTRSEPTALTPDGVDEREQRRAHRVAANDPLRLPRRTAVAVDGKCLRGAKRTDGSQVFVLSAVRHIDAVTLAAREIGAKTNEIGEFAPLLDQIADTDLTGAVVTVDALHAQRAHAVYLVEQRHAHYLITIKDNQPTLAAQLRRLPWKQVPVLHRQTSRGHGRHEIREVQVVTVDDLLFPTPARPCGSAAGAASRARRSGPPRPSTRSRTCPSIRPDPTKSLLGHENTGRSRTACTGSETSPSAKTPARPAPATPPPSWQPYATSSAARSALPAGPTPPAHAAPTPHPQPHSPSTASHDYVDIPGTLRGPVRSPRDTDREAVPHVVPVGHGRWGFSRRPHRTG